MRKQFIKDNALQWEECTPTFEKNTDLLVCGLGSGGVFCALAAAKKGARVLAFDRLSGVGGMNTMGLITGYYYGYEDGTYRELDQKALEPAEKFITSPKRFQAEAIESTEYKALRDNGVEILFNTVLIGLYMDGNRVVGGELFSDGKRINVRSAQMADATSDGHVIRLSGVQTYFGRGTDESAAPFSAYARFLDKDGKFTRSTDDAGTVNPFRAAEFTKKTLASRAGLSMENAEFTVAVAELPGVREGLRFEGEDTLTFRDIIYRREAEKVLFYAYSDIDKHGFDTAMDTEEFQNFLVVSNLSTVAFRIAVPLGAVVPKNVKGLVSACRSLSIDSYASGGVRMNRDMKRLGECVGIGLAMALREGNDFSDIDYEAFCKEAAVARMGDETLDVGFDNLRNHSEYRPVRADKSFEALGAELDSEQPGGALYSCLLHPEKYGDYLCRLLQNPSGVLQGNNAALALGMAGNKACLPRLREMVKNRSCLYYKDCRRTNQFPSVAAICLLGRLGEPEDMDLLMPLVFDEKEYERPLYHTLAPDYVFCETEYVNFVYYQHFTHSVMALVKLGRKYGRSIREDLSKLYAGESGKRLKFRLGNEQYNEAFSKSLEDFFEESLRLIEKA